MILTTEEINLLFNYNIENGNLYYKYNSRNKKIGDIVCEDETERHKYVSIKRKQYLLHHLIYKMLFNEDIPLGFVIEHINGIKTDNRLVNLRLCTQQYNCWSYTDLSNEKLISKVNKKYRVEMHSVPVIFHNRMNKCSNSTLYRSKSMSYDECLLLKNEILKYRKDIFSKIKYNNKRRIK